MITTYLMILAIGFPTFLLLCAGINKGIEIAKDLEITFNRYRRA